MRVAVAGGQGFIGRHAVAALAAAGHAVVAFDRDDGPAAVRDAAPEALVWAAGTRSADPAQMRREHVEAPLEALDTFPAPVRRVVYLSSGEVYGDADVPYREDATLRGRTPYALAKLEGEAALAARARDLGADLVIVRPAVVYGPGQQGPMLLPSLLAALRRGERFPMTAGGQTRDFLHVDDLCDLLVRCLAPGAPAGLFNAGTGRETRVADAARMLARAVTGDESRVVLGAIPPREGEAARYVLDPSRAAARLGWTARVGIEEGLARLARPAAPGGPG